MNPAELSKGPPAVGLKSGEPDLGVFALSVAGMETRDYDAGATAAVLHTDHCSHSSRPKVGGETVADSPSCTPLPHWSGAGGVCAHRVTTRTSFALLG